MSKITAARAVLLTLCIGMSSSALAKYPDTTIEGLPRVESKYLDALYIQADADLSSYRKVLLEDCEVAFRKNWQRDQNRSRGASDKVQAEDMARIRADLATRFREVFTAELQSEGGFEVVTAAGEGVLTLRPKIVDLDVFAPDLKSPGRSTTLTTSAGRMTLQMDLIDAETGALIGRVIDRRRAREEVTGRITNSVTNRAEGDRILRRWATILREVL